EILISESAWEEMTCLFAPSLTCHIAEVICINVLIAIQNNRLYFLRIMALCIINDSHRRKKVSKLCNSGFVGNWIK
ncbi:hypothetical protein LEI99_15035, partial [Salmonella enterica]|nr:hypothetical protein [Salmonella enterica]